MPFTMTCFEFDLFQQKEIYCLLYEPNLDMIISIKERKCLKRKPSVSVISNPYRAGVQNCEVKIRIAVFAQACENSIVKLNRFLKKFIQYLLSHPQTYCCIAEKAYALLSSKYSVFHRSDHSSLHFLRI